MMPRPSPPTQWITDPVTFENIEEATSSLYARFFSSPCLSPMREGRALHRYRAMPITEKNSTMIGNAHLIAAGSGVLTRYSS